MSAAAGVDLEKDVTSLSVRRTFPTTTSASA
jgi:hypothetical protein